MWEYYRWECNKLRFWRADEERSLKSHPLCEWRHCRRRVDGSAQTVHEPRSTLLASISTVRSLAFPWPISLYRSLWKAGWHVIFLSWQQYLIMTSLLDPLKMLNKFSNNSRQQYCYLYQYNILILSIVRAYTTCGMTLNSLKQNIARRPRRSRRSRPTVKIPSKQAFFFIYKICLTPRSPSLQMELMVCIVK